MLQAMKKDVAQSREKNYDCVANCGVERALKLIGNKWTLLIIRSLCSKPKGFNELLRIIETISPKMLSTRLKELVDSGMVKKTVFPTNPPQVEYALTPVGISLKPIIESLDNWGETLS